MRSFINTGRKSKVTKYKAESQVKLVMPAFKGSKRGEGGYFLKRMDGWMDGLRFLQYFIHFRKMGW